MDVYFTHTVLSYLERIATKLDDLMERIDEMSDAMDALTAKVAEIEGVVPSVLALIAGLRAEIVSLASTQEDPTALLALVDRLDAKSDELAAAVVENPA